ncbi:linear amide C-N hydrolase [Nocardioides speluncae]|uniref:linear amide C-N hydrolase n=1 Tax=Nocardioides speluncae TaxID=2670337 RepID=UPI00137A1A07|nr:linear amide C-N hydrolase [Nocardioides speluncae]
MLSRREVLQAGVGVAAGAALTPLAGCSESGSPAETAQPSAPGSGTPKGGGTTTAEPLRIVQTGAEQQRSLASVVRIDEHPTYQIDWWGSSPTVEGEGELNAAARAEWAVTASLPPFGCTLFAALGDPDRPIVARNFDWDPHPAMVVRARPSNGFASTAVTDLAYYGFDDIRRPLDLDDAGVRESMSRAPSLAFDGVNEHGLFIGLAADEGARAAYSDDLLAVGGVSVQRLVLDRCRTVESAKAVVAAYNLDFAGGPPLHYLIADRAGAATIVEFVGGRLTFHDRPEQQPWLVLENFNYGAVPEPQRSAYPRWNGCTERLADSDGRMTVGAALETLYDVRQDHTQWSVVYDLANGDAHLFTGQARERVHRIPLAR